MMRALRRNKDPLAAPPYLSRYKLRESPFANGARFFYADPERAQTLNMLQHLTQYSEELLLVTGPAGSGKSTLLEQYLTRADEDWKVCRVSATETPDPGQLFLAAARCFGLHTDGVASDALLGALQEHLNRLQQTMTPVLVVDDADRLSDDALEIVVRLAELPGEHGKLVRVILFADSAILPRFDSARFASGPRPHRLDLKPLDEAQTIAYLQHRLATAGFAGGPLFLPRDLKRIHKQSLGWPGGINLQAHEVLMSKRSGSSIPWPYVVAALAVAAAAGTWLQFSGGDHVPPAGVTPPPSPVAAAPERPIVRYAEPTGAAPSALTVRSGETVQITCLAPTVAESPRPLPQPMLREVAPVAEPPAAPAAPVAAMTVPAEPAPEPAPTEPGTAPPVEAPVAEPVAPSAPVEPPAAAEPAVPVEAVPAVPTPVIERVEPDPAPGSRQAQTLTLHGRHFTPDSRVTVSWRGRRKTLAAGQVRVLDGERIAITVTTGTTPDTWSVVVAGADGRASAPFQFKVAAPVKAAAAPAALPAAAPAPAAAQPAVAGFRDAAWLRAQAPRHFTVQLVGAGTEEAVRAHLRGYDVRGDIALITVQRDGKPWFVLFWGNFAERAAAERAVAALPAPLKRVSPWIRPFADVHAELNAGVAR
ncbi:AAA family ATPase [Sulfurivermis fontis]|uniref:AAA family ATPase n=1 Tax=Sulfurivermis fontis TaxID=1972068 RepID=UPI000FD90A88|nr:AAA family ATPase [Sulfurivermis fontis]